ncbi:MAG: large conductance mechanosensitive channel protein MscL [Propionicimonas sp.]
MKGFKDFLMRGNLVDLAVAVIIATSFGADVSTFTQIIMDVIGKMGGNPNFDTVAIGGVNVGKFITAVVSFVILAAIVYFGVIKPYEMLRTKLSKETEVTQAAGESTDELLAEIRDILKSKN